MTRSIRRAGVPDWIAIAELDETGWSANRHADRIPDGEHVWRLWVEHAVVLIAEADGELIGFALAFPTLKAGKFFVHKMLVDAGHRGRGVGDALMGALTAHADAKGFALTLTTDTNNARMHAVCAKHGFDQGAMHAGFYRPHEDRLVLRRAPRSGA